MRLKRLVCRGFKSFADRTEFEFDSMLTGIIGPNGCGKSNVVDAIKWVLGDQRARSLRGQEMTDLIFKGAEGRDAMGMAQVTITFEDDEGRFDGCTEIDVGRRLTVDKESHYLLNGDSVRLKDVRDMLMDTGLGVGAYSVLEQGRIDAVLSANPESRRAIFEEAAGISKFKLQKREALRKLERTEQNLARITDLVEERGRRIRSLKIQAGKARRYREIRVRLRDLRSALAVLDGQQLRAGLAAEHERVRQLGAEIVEAERGQQEALTALVAVDEAIASGADASERLQRQLHECQTALAAERDRIVAQRLRMEELGADAGGCQQRAGVLGEQRRERQDVLGKARDGLAAREQELIELHRQLEADRQAVSGAERELRAVQGRREEIRERLLECIHERTRTLNRAHDQEAQLGALKARERRVHERLVALGEEGGRVGDEQAILARELEDIAQRERILAEREAAALADLDEADEAAAGLARMESDLRYKLSQVEGRKHALEDMESHMEGLDQGPRWVLENHPDGLRGRLLDLLEVDLAHSAALQAALGPYVQALVVDTADHAEAILAKLAADKLGRVLMLVEEEFGAHLERPFSLPLPAGARLLSEVVRSEAADGSVESRRMVNWLLRGVCLVDDLSCADAGRADLCFVTPTGALVCGPRVEGGASEADAGLVVRRSHIHALGEQAEVLHGRLTELQAGKDQAADRVERLKAELRQLGGALQGVRQQGQEGLGQRARLDGRAADLSREQEELGLEEAEVHRARYAALAAMGRHLLNAHLVRMREQRHGRREAELEVELSAAQRALATTTGRQQERRLEQVAASSDRDALQESIRIHDQALREIDRAVADLVEREQQAVAGVARAEQEIERLQEAIGGHTERQGVLAGEHAEQVGALDELKAERARRQEVVRACEGRRAELAEQLTAGRLQAAEVEHRFARLEERLREDTDVELRRCLGEVRGIGLVAATDFHGPPAPVDVVQWLQGPPLPPEWVEAERSLGRLWEDPEFPVADAKKDVQVMQAQIDRLGSVNLDAVAELEDEEHQYVFLKQETEDLKQARRSLMETLKRLEVESRQLFEHTFAEARKNFQNIFRKLFQGGRADMYLQDTEDALESGIEIVARPPGKELQSINLLSGGERSLTALAILFAVFKVKPSPFCILDEVDAALDDTNVERFLRVLRDFVGETQFCIVTHHKRTMAECQMLYGITMQKRGVSSRIAVALDQVDGFTEQAEAQVQGAAPVGVGSDANGAGGDANGAGGDANGAGGEAKGAGGGAKGAGGSKPDPALKQRVAGEEAVGF